MAAFFSCLFVLHWREENYAREDGCAREHNRPKMDPKKIAYINTISRSFECSDVCGELSSPPSAPVGGEREGHYHPKPPAIAKLAGVPSRV